MQDHPQAPGSDNQPEEDEPTVIKLPAANASTNTPPTTKQSSFIISQEPANDSGSSDAESDMAKVGADREAPARAIEPDCLDARTMQFDPFDKAAAEPPPFTVVEESAPAPPAPTPADSASTSSKIPVAQPVGLGGSMTNVVLPESGTKDATPTITVHSPADSNNASQHRLNIQPQTDASPKQEATPPSQETMYIPKPGSFDVDSEELLLDGLDEDLDDEFDEDEEGDCPPPDEEEDIPVRAEEKSRSSSVLALILALCAAGAGVFALVTSAKKNALDLLPKRPTSQRKPASGVKRLGATAQEEIVYKGNGDDLQQVIDDAPEGAVVICDKKTRCVFRSKLGIHKRMTLKGLNASLPKGLGIELLRVYADDVSLFDLELHGNYDSVPQEKRKALIRIRGSRFHVERCRFYDGSKDGVTITPDRKSGKDIVGGVVKDIQAWRMGRDAVSISGGNVGQRVRNITVENVRLIGGYLRGAVEISDGTDNIKVQKVHAEKALYAVDVQDHRKPKCAPNTRIVIKDVQAVDCEYIIRTANSALGHRGLTLSNLLGSRCRQPVHISNTDGVVIDGLEIRRFTSEEGTSPIYLENCNGVTLKGVTVLEMTTADSIVTTNCTGVVIEE